MRSWPQTWDTCGVQSTTYYIAHTNTYICVCIDYLFGAITRAHQGMSLSFTLCQSGCVLYAIQCIFIICNVSNVSLRVPDMCTVWIKSYQSSQKITNWHTSYYYIWLSVDCVVHFFYTIFLNEIICSFSRFFSVLLPVAIVRLVNFETEPYGFIHG